MERGIEKLMKLKEEDNDFFNLSVNLRDINFISKYKLTKEECEFLINNNIITSLNNLNSYRDKYINLIEYLIKNNSYTKGLLEDLVGKDKWECVTLVECIKDNDYDDCLGIYKKIIFEYICYKDKKTGIKNAIYFTINSLKNTKDNNIDISYMEYIIILEFLNFIENNINDLDYEDWGNVSGINLPISFIKKHKSNLNSYDFPLNGEEYLEDDFLKEFNYCFDLEAVLKNKYLYKMKVDVFNKICTDTYKLIGNCNAIIENENLWKIDKDIIFSVKDRLDFKEIAKRLVKDIEYRENYCSTFANNYYQDTINVKLYEDDSFGLFLYDDESEDTIDISNIAEFIDFNDIEYYRIIPSKIMLRENNIKYPVFNKALAYYNKTYDVVTMIKYSENFISYVNDVLGFNLNSTPVSKEEENIIKEYERVKITDNDEFYIFEINDSLLLQTIDHLDFNKIKYVNLSENIFVYNINKFDLKHLIIENLKSYSINTKITIAKLIGIEGLMRKCSLTYDEIDLIKSKI